jgi:hypothetical protein
MCNRKLNRGSHECHPQNPRATYRGLSITTDSVEHSPPYNIPLTDRVVPRVYGPEMLITVLTEPATLPILRQINPSSPLRHIRLEIHFILSSNLCPYISYGIFTVGTNDETPA